MVYLGRLHRGGTHVVITTNALLCTHAFQTTLRRKIRQGEPPIATLLVGDEPRDIVKGCPENGLEAWRRLKNRLDPATEATRIHAIIRALQPPKVKHIRAAIPAV